MTWAPGLDNCLAISGTVEKMSVSPLLSPRDGRCLGRNLQPVVNLAAEVWVACWNTKLVSGLLKVSELAAAGSGPYKSSRFSVLRDL